MTDDPQAKPKEPERLSREHDRTNFESGAVELDQWLKEYSWQNQQANNATTYVTALGDGRVVGYYALTVAGYERGATPQPVARRAPSAVPCFLLARLAVDRQWQGHGLGWGLLQDVLRRVLSLSKSVAAPALLVHARDEVARDFYCHHADFVPSPIEPLHLFLPMRTIEAEFEALND